MSLSKFSKLLTINRNTIILCANITLFYLLLKFLPIQDPINKALALLVFIAVLWVTQAIPVVITALLVPILASALHLLTVKSALASFSDPVIFLLLGGFTLAAAFHQQGLDQAIVHRLMRLSKGNFFLSCLLLFTFTAFISMWISNTASTIMVLPLAMGMLSNIDFKKNRSTYVFVLLGIAYAANIGGLATVIGSTPNAIAASILKLNFATWFKAALPTTLALYISLVLLLLIVIRPNSNHNIKIIDTPFKLDIKKTILIIIIFALAVIAWLFSRSLSAMLGIDRYFDSLVAISIIVLLCITGAVEWGDIEKHTSWGTLLLFGGGLTLSYIFSTTGTSAYLVELLSLALFGVKIWVALLFVIVFVVFFTEVSTNTATGALMIPLFMVMAEAIGFSSEAMAITVALCASCAFMLPVATLPNAIVFGTGYIETQDMLRIGFMMNIISIAVLTVFSLKLYPTLLAQ